MSRLPAMLGVVAAATVACVLSACDPVAFGNGAQPVTSVVTPIGAERYVFAPSPGSVVVSSPTTNTSGNLRMLFRAPDVPVATDEIGCMGIAAQTAAYNQQGVALRIRTISGRTQAILITKNIFPSTKTLLNVHVFDSTAASTLTQIAGFDYTAIFGNYYPDASDPTWRPASPLPWNVCARVNGSTVQVKAWRGDENQPAWDALEAHNRTVALPGSGWTYAGQAGWFVGHLSPGDRTTFTGLSTLSS
jgi:hypothetical protein